MPVVHEYRNKRGMYVKARHGSSMVTYQLAPGGVAELHRRGMSEGSQLTPDILHRLVKDGLAYTHGSGAGVVDDPTPPPRHDKVTVSVGEPPMPRKQRHKKPKHKPGGRLYPSPYRDTRPAPPPPPPPALLFPLSDYADYKDILPTVQELATRPAPPPVRTVPPALPPRANAFQLF